MKRFKELQKKLKDKTISDIEKKELFILAFGKDYIQNENKGRKKTL